MDKYYGKRCQSFCKIYVEISVHHQYYNVSKVNKLCGILSSVLKSKKRQENLASFLKNMLKMNVISNL